ncbi:MAG TPA: SpoIIE family protein phosphatase [Terriglobales bacterium]|jgi:sigma-B regulation protein RsbU (phosphoserine phosphatase)
MAAEPIAAAAPDLTSFMLEVSDLANGTLDLEQVLHRVAELVRRVVHFEIFAILLVNERTQELRIHLAVGHLPEVVDRVRVKVGQGITGRAASTQQPQRVNDVRQHPHYIAALEGVRSELAVPILWKNQAIGVIDIQAPEVNAFSDAHVHALVLVASRIASAIENAKLYRSAVQREKTLELLNGISREMTSILSVDDLLTRTAEMVRRVIDYQLFSVLMVNAAGDKLEHRMSVKLGENVNIKHDIPVGKGIAGAALAARQAVIVKDVRNDPRYIMVNPEVRSELAVPLVYQDQVLGVLDLEHAKKGYYTERHARTMSTLAAQMAVAVVNARLYQQVSRAERHMERDLRMAQEIQRHLLPARCPELPSLRIAARSVPARQLGGDLYDFISYKQQRTAIAVGDVSGKGAGAALYGAVVSGILRTQAAHQPRPAEMLAAVNQILLERRVESQFMTLIYALWSERSGQLHIANSGLPYPIHVTAAGCRIVPAAGVPLGMLDGSRYEEITLRPEPGDAVVFVSDGITEFMNADGEEYGRTRLEHLLRGCREAGPEAMAAAIFDDVERFGAGLAATDDRTVVVLKAARRP